ncbi:MAG TPA: 50S ribosomal protein L35 [Anaerolineae bacterium]|nr:50S ribosomal protein L35 [Anaerolineae bacterium]
MPKLKTHKSTSKRFRLSQGGKGKLMRTKMGKSHFRRRRSRRVRALFDEMLVVEHKGTIRRVKRLAPYLKQKS